MVKAAFELSEEFQIPVLLRPTIRVSHGKQNVKLESPDILDRPANFTKDPARWAATPRFRLILHTKLNETLSNIQQKFEKDTRWNQEFISPGNSSLGIITCSASYVALLDLLEEFDLTERINILKIGTPYPLPQKKIADFVKQHSRVLVIEEPDSVIEAQIIDKSKILGRLSGHIPLQGELSPEVLCDILARVLDEPGIAELKTIKDTKLEKLVQNLDLPIRKPTLCAGCPERAAFFAIKKAVLSP